MLFEIDTHYYLLPVLPQQHPSNYSSYFIQTDKEGKENVYFNNIIKIEKPAFLKKLNNNTFVLAEKGIMICSEI